MQSLNVKTGNDLYQNRLLQDEVSGQYSLLQNIFGKLAFTLVVLDRQAKIVYSNRTDISRLFLPADMTVSNRHTMVFHTTQLAKVFRSQFLIESVSSHPQSMTKNQAMTKNQDKPLRIAALESGFTVEFSPFNENCTIRSSYHHLCLMAIYDNSSWSEELGRAVQQKYQLTPAEVLVCRGIIELQSTKAIARSRNTSVETVKSQLRSVFGKTGVDNRAQLVRRLRQAALIMLSDG